LHTAGAEAIEHERSPTRQLLHWLADPNLAFLFLSIGALAVLYELASPGMGLGGVIGAVLLVLGFVSLSVLPVSLAGLLLLALAVALFVAELFALGSGCSPAAGRSRCCLRVCCCSTARSGSPRRCCGRSRSWSAGARSWRAA